MHKMTDNEKFIQRMLLKKQERKKQERRILAVAGAIALAGGALLLSGYVKEEPAKVSTVHTVQPGDTLRGISEEYLQKETANKRYILQFEHDIEQINPWLKGHTLQPGDEITIEYYIDK